MTWVMRPKLNRKSRCAFYRFVGHLGQIAEPVPTRLPAGVRPETDYFEFTNHMDFFLLQPDFQASRGE
jgi:hypothetical protein